MFSIEKASVPSFQRNDSQLPPYQKHQASSDVNQDTLHSLDSDNPPPPPYTITPSASKVTREKLFSLGSDAMHSSIWKHRDILKKGDFESYGYKSKKETEAALTALQNQQAKLTRAHERVMKRSDSRFNKIRDSLTYLIRIISNIFHLRSVKNVQTVNDFERIFQNHFPMV